MAINLRAFSYDSRIQFHESEGFRRQVTATRRLPRTKHPRRLAYGHSPWRGVSRELPTAVDDLRALLVLLARSETLGIWFATRLRMSRFKYRAQSSMQQSKLWPRETRKRSMTRRYPLAAGIRARSRQNSLFQDRSLGQS